ncbi:hypothetical protein ACJ2A9_21180 [Anaerobacillus sp. MEB173]|uniref:hypothetical protein n=1 Tax=Anaerobacillus sp. MEB173 TaxID=3383345 RepID=UPI003F8F51E0
MRYKLLDFRWSAAQRKFSVMDFKEGRIINFTEDALMEHKLDEDLIEYMRSIWKSHIVSGLHEYKGKH